jgi:hypothetical protein
MAALFFFRIRQFWNDDIFLSSFDKLSSLPALCVAVRRGRIFAPRFVGCPAARVHIYPRFVWLFGKGAYLPALCSMSGEGAYLPRVLHGCPAGL